MVFEVARRGAPCRAEQHPAAQRQKADHAADQGHRLREFAQLVPLLLARIQRREVAAHPGRRTEHRHYPIGA
jgi:hypothetical protein